MSDITARRLALRIAEVQERRYDREFSVELDHLIDTIHFPSTPIDDWRLFVDQELRDSWSKLEKAVRFGIYITALRAHNEMVKLREQFAAERAVRKR